MGPSFIGFAKVHSCPCLAPPSSFDHLKNVLIRFSAANYLKTIFKPVVGQSPFYIVQRAPLNAEQLKYWEKNSILHLTRSSFHRSGLLIINEGGFVWKGLQRRRCQGEIQEQDLEERSEAISRIGLNSNKTTLRGRFISCFACGTHLF